jgi:hypothetical protein
VTEQGSGLPGLVAVLRASVDRDTEDALSYCEQTIPTLTTLPNRDRMVGLEAMRFGARLQVLRRQLAFMIHRYWGLADQ